MTMKCIKEGDSGEDVTTLQYALIQEGFGPTFGGWSFSMGYFGGGTKEAVMEFQTQKLLDIDGVVGPDTWKALGRTGASCGSGRSRSSATGTDTGVIPAAPTGNGNGGGLALYQRPWFWPAVGGTVLVLIFGGLWSAKRGEG